MEATRQIYWNVSPLGLPVMYLLTALAMAVFFYGFFRRIKVYRQGKPLGRLDHLPKRIFRAVSEGLFQGKVSREKGIGELHQHFLWAFVILFIGTTLIFIETDILKPLFGVTFLKGDFYRVFSLALDLSGVVVLLMLGGMFTRRFWVKKIKLPPKPFDRIFYALLFLILLTGFGLEGLRMAVTETGIEPELVYYSPVGMYLGYYLQPLGWETLIAAHQGLWWLHMVMVMAWIALIPYTRLKHLVLTPINYALYDEHPFGHLPTINLEDETQESFGLAKPSDLGFKDIFDTDACTSCKRCEDRCPAFNTGKPLSPMLLVQQMGEVCFELKDGSLVDKIGKDALWACTTCGACQAICPAEVEHLPKIVGMRRNLVLMEGEFAGDEVAQAMDHLEVNANPLGSAPGTRADWAEGLGLVEPAEADWLYFPGCYASFDPRNQKVAKAFIKVAQAAGLKLAILGKAEKCCGEPARKMGNEYLYQNLAQANIEAFKSAGVKGIVTTCPHCFQTLGTAYKDLGLDIEVLHYTELIDQLWKDFKFKLNRIHLEVTYHDSCQLGRYGGIYDPPRNLLEACGADFREMKSHHADSFCCGAGGGRIMAEEKVGQRINQTRAKMALDLGADQLISSCPFCLTMFEDGVKGLEAEHKLKPRDLVELLADALPTLEERL
ncbi:MAG: electron transporter [Candidatus Lambdaproteobacteria bacterium RIFOXYD2_FULL_50_16]|uniref:Electron transporter n=1 Tax=Candidatus Lambdaproteobacteria bacterium RIFOXYD2_FULL_50_16 TaxID=1817772 RepID=A0A1F6G8Q5_9PROT|nr:MAG: electron transporter [Candidatus Lambdaproteobacteria bacterium RIFOXYD2_FULL_50_16]